MSKIQSDRQEDIQFARQTDRVTVRQNDSMADSRAAKEPALVLLGKVMLILEIQKLIVIIRSIMIFKDLSCRNKLFSKKIL